MKVDNADAIARRLRDRGAKPAGRHLETNIFFDTEDRALLAADEGLRVRVSREVDTGEETCIITHKGPNRHGPLKNREETEVQVLDCEPAVRLLERLGYVRTLTFQKRRHSYRLADCKVELDEMPYLGHFIEIEGPSEDSVQRVREQLGLADQPVIKNTYVAMLASYLQERGESRAEVSFETTDEHG